VWRAVCKPLGEVVAVKTIELESVKSDLQEVMREAHAMRMSDHSNVLKLYASFVVGDLLWMVMPFVSGGSLYSIMKWAFSDGLEEATIAAATRPVLRALAYLHQNGNIHRDVKAGNILINGHGHMFLGDLGVAADMDRTGSWGNDRSKRQTFVGTPCWMAPEVMDSSQKGYDWHADIWSFGITLLELAHGHAPFARLPPMKVLLMTLTEEPPKLEENYGRRHFSKAMREVVSQCLQKDPNARPTAQKLLDHRFFKQAHPEGDYLVRHLLKGLPTLCDRIEALATNQGLRQHKNELEGRSESSYRAGIDSWDFCVNHDNFVRPKSVQNVPSAADATGSSGAGLGGGSRTGSPPQEAAGGTRPGGPLAAAAAASAATARHRALSGGDGRGAGTSEAPFEASVAHQAWIPANGHASANNGGGGGGGSGAPSSHSAGAGAIPSLKPTKSLGKKTESRGRFQVYDSGASDEEDSHPAGSARSERRGPASARGSEATSPVHLSGMLRLASAPSLAVNNSDQASPTTPKDGHLPPGLPGGPDSGRKMRMGRFVVASEELPSVAEKGVPAGGAAATSSRKKAVPEGVVTQLQQALLQANRQQESLQKLLASLAVSRAPPPPPAPTHHHYHGAGGGGSGGGGGGNHGDGEHGGGREGPAQGSGLLVADSMPEKPVPKAERTIAAKVSEHACVKAVGDLERRVRQLAEENEKLKRRNMQLERDLNKYYNLYLEAEENREEHREEEEELRVEKEATARVEAKEKEHKLERGMRAQSSGNLMQGSTGALAGVAGKLERKTTPH